MSVILPSSVLSVSLSLPVSCVLYVWERPDGFLFLFLFYFPTKFDSLLSFLEIGGTWYVSFSIVCFHATSSIWQYVFNLMKSLSLSLSLSGSLSFVRRNLCRFLSLNFHFDWNLPRVAISSTKWRPLWFYWLQSSVQFRQRNAISTNGEKIRWWLFSLISSCRIKKAAVRCCCYTYVVES